MADVFDEFSWAVGIIEGEGTIGAHHNRPPRGRSTYYQLHVGVTSTDEDVIIRLKLFFGGTSNGPHRRPPDKPYWRWSVQSREAVVTLVNRIRPYMSPRRQRQIDKVLRINKEQPLRRPRGNYNLEPCGFPGDRRRGAGYKWHTSRGERACEKCMVANNKYVWKMKLRRRKATTARLS